MPTEFIEIFRDENWKGKGNINLVKGKYVAILHNHEKGKLASTVFMVKANIDEIDKVAGSHVDVKHYKNFEEVQVRGLIIKSHATPTIQEVVELADKLTVKHGIDLTKHKHPKSNKNLIDHFKTIEHIGVGNQKCIVCGVVQSDKLIVCENCGADLRDKGKRNVRLFDITAWK